MKNFVLVILSLSIPLMAFTSEDTISSPIAKFQEELRGQINKSLKREMKEINNDISVNINQELQSLIKNDPTFKKFVNPHNIKSISYLLASNKGVGKSSFGHSYLRFSYDDELKENDVTVEFVANVPSEDLDIFRGMGIGENYGFSIDKSNYSRIKSYHIMAEDRDLTSYILKLTDQQKKMIASKINELIMIGIKKDYAFFTNNCADIVTDVLNSALTNKIKGIRAVVPNMIPDLLENLDLVADEVLDPRKSTKIKEIVEKDFPDFLDNIDDIKVINLKKQLSSERFNDRKIGYLKLQLINENLSFQQSRKIIPLVNNILMYENGQTRLFFEKAFATKKSKIFEFAQIKYQLPRGRFKIKDKKLITENNKVYLDVTLKTSNGNEIFRFHLKSLTYKNGKIFKGDEIISYNFGSNLVTEEFYNPATYLDLEITEIDQKKYLTSLLVREKKSFQVIADNNFTKFDDELAYKNGQLAEYSNMGLCDAHTRLMQILKMNTIYLPQERPLSEAENLNLIKEAYKGDIIVVPGYKNAKSFTESIDIKELAFLMKKNQAYQFEVISNFFSPDETTDLTGNNFYILENILALGIKPTINFETRRISNGLSYISIGHAVVVNKIERNSEGIYVLEIIDPNKTLQSGLYKFNPMTGILSTEWYGDVKPQIRKFNLKITFATTHITNDRKLSRSLERTAKATGKYDYTLYDILK